jgi:succinylglutamate desuccinylase
LGIEETIAGASLEWFADRGIAAFAVEGGQHESPDAVDNHEAVLWELLVRLGIVEAGAVDLAPHRDRLRRAVGDAPPIVEITHRREIAPEDRFRMEPGFVNFTQVEKGQLLARDRTGALLAPAACHVMLPLYQELGDDGYFLARRVSGFWLWLARALRASGVGGLLPLMPGIRRAPGEPDTLLADPRVARWFVVEVFHLLGYRKESRRGALLAFSRRRSRAGNAGL